MTEPSSHTSSRSQARASGSGSGTRRSVLIACALLTQSLPLLAAPTAPTARPAPATPARSATAAVPAPRRTTPLPYAPIGSIFHISKSENRNEVHYAVRVDAACRPLGPTPMYGYWRMWDKGPNVTAPLLSHEEPAYGLGAPRSIQLTDRGGQIRISLRGFPERPLLIETGRFGAVCGARVMSAIQKQPAMLLSIYVKIGFLFSVDYAIVRGLRASDGLAVEEKVHE